MKRRTLTTIAVLLVLLTARSLYVYSEATYVNAFGTECIHVHDSLNFVVRDFFDKHPGCKTVATGTFHDATYVYNECVELDVVNGSHVAFDKKDACDAFAALSWDEQLRAVGGKLGRK